MALAHLPPLVGAGRGGGSRGPRRLSDAPPRAYSGGRCDPPPCSSPTRGEETHRSDPRVNSKAEGSKDRLSKRGETPGPVRRLTFSWTPEVRLTACAWVDAPIVAALHSPPSGGRSLRKPFEARRRGQRPRLQASTEPLGVRREGQLKGAGDLSSKRAQNRTATFPPTDTMPSASSPPSHWLGSIFRCAMAVA
jgi:hypothetical protein